jgi:single stranded DNA-binding protein
MKEQSMSTSAPNLNSVTLVGQLTDDPELRSLPDGRSVCNLRLAVNDQRDQPLFIDVATFGAGAEACAVFLSKGRSVGVTGRRAARVAREGRLQALKALCYRSRCLRL